MPNEISSLICTKHDTIRSHVMTKITVVDFYDLRIMKMYIFMIHYIEVLKIMFNTLFAYTVFIVRMFILIVYKKKNYYFIY